MTTHLSQLTLVDIGSRIAEHLGAIAGVHSAAGVFEWSGFSTIVDVESADIAERFARQCLPGTELNRLFVNKLAEALKRLDTRLVSSPEEIAIGVAPSKACGRPCVVVILHHVAASPLPTE